MKTDLTLVAVRMAEERFRDNLSFAFIGGSRATRTASTSSDIDIFITLSSSDPVAEREYAESLRQIHHDHGLSFDHCGELFSRSTLDSLLSFTDRYVSAMPAIMESACYESSCILSIFRKGHVVFNFLASPKLHVRDVKGELAALTIQAEQYVARWHKSYPTDTDHIRFPHGSPQELLRKRWDWDAGDAWLDTPIGVGLERWFRDGLIWRIRHVAPGPFPDMNTQSTHTCPLTLRSEIHAIQCLAVTPEEFHDYRSQS